MNPLVALTTLFAAAQAGLIAAPYNLPYAAGPYAYGTRALAAPAYGYAAAPAAYGYAPYTRAYGYAPVATPSTQYAAQDELGNLNYGYANINSAKQEVGNAYGGVVGSYSYVDPNGELQRVDYVADALGFRVKGTNLPVGPAVPEVPELKAPVFNLEAPVYTGVAPEPVQDTPEVAAAKAEFMKVFEEAKKQKRSAPADTEVLEEVDLKIKPLAYAAPVTGAFPYRTYNAYPYAAGYGLGYNGFGYNGLYNGFGYSGLYNGLGYNGLYGLGLGYGLY